MSGLKPVKKRILAAWTVASFILTLAAIVTVMRLGATPIAFHPVNTCVIAIISIQLIVLGRSVKKLKAKKPTWLTHSQAGYVPVLAQACAYFGAIVIGITAAMIVAALPRHESYAMLSYVLSAVAGLCSAVFMLISGLVVEQWCIVDDDDDDDDGKAQGTATPAAA